MKEIVRRSAEEIIGEIREKAYTYTPEWHFDPENPDIGGALAAVYAGIQSGMDRKYALLPEKLRIDFFNCLNVSMRSAAPARGYAVFSLSGDETEGSVLTAGIPLRSDVTDEAGESVPVELTEDVNVVPDRLRVIFETRGSRDYIGCLYRSDMEEKSGFPLFGMSAENLEHHLFRLSHPWLFRIRRHAAIGLRFYDGQGLPLPEEIMSRFTDPGAVRFFYETGEEGSREVLAVTGYKNGTLWLKKNAEQLPFTETEVRGISSFWLSCEVMDIRGLSGFAPARITLSAECASALPDVIYAAGTDQPVQEPCMPFGERFSVYDEIYFGAGDALSKKGAVVDLSFEEEFVRIPITENEEEDGVDWKLVMPKDQFRPEKQYDITVEEVIWEYYNGSGWARLFTGHENTDAFSSARGSGRQLRRIRFTCPADLSPVLAGPGENYYIRARIIKVNNAFKTAGQYITPVISDIRISYSYPGEGVEPEYMLSYNHMEEDMVLLRRERAEGRLLHPVLAAEDPRPAMYMGFDALPSEGPVRILWETEQVMDTDQPQVIWEYYRDGGFHALHPADETDSFRKTGLLTFSGLPDAARGTLFGEDLCWIRAVRTESADDLRTFPGIRTWYMNAARVVTLRHGLSEYWTVETWEPGAQISLLNRNIHELELWVREDERLGPEETEKLRSEQRYREIIDENGDRRGAWIRWEQTDALRRHGPGERVYLLDENEGLITFGGGACGKVPAPGVTDGIHVLYSIGGGRVCNLPAGSITGIDYADNYVSTAANPLPLTGAYDRETVQAAIRRASAENKHHLRAVTEDDFEDLAKSMAGDIRQARCLSGINSAGDVAPGVVTLVLLTDDYTDTGAGFENLKKRVYDAFADKLPASLQCGEEFQIRRAEVVELELHVEAVIEDYSQLYQIQKNIQESLDRFLDPISGNADGAGWEIGSLPERFQLETLIRGTAGIERISRCIIFSRIITRTGKPEVSYDDLRSAPFVVPVSGKHRIRLEKRS